MERDSESFVALLTGSQNSLYACILALLPDRSAARDVLQETNITLWNKAADFQEGTHFMAWASRIARYHILNHRKKMRRDRLVFDDSLFEFLCERQAERVDEFDRREEALRGCLNKLPPGQRELLEERYSAKGSVQQIASREGKSVGAVSQSLYRIRETLLNCIHESTLAES